MGLVRKLTSSRMSRVGWILAVLALAGAMALSFVFAYSSVGDQQRAAQARAVADTTRKPLSDLTATLVSKPIQEDSYRALLKDVKDHVMKDDRVLRVRIFNLNGTLVFSTDALPWLGSVWLLVAGHTALCLPYFLQAVIADMQRLGLAAKK